MKRIWTVGHSNLTLEGFLRVVEGIDVIADVRRYPASRKFPHFNRESLERAKGYWGFPDLGGRRSGDGSRHSALRVAAFRAYAAYMETPEFHAALGELESLAAERKTAVMCAEAPWFKCHRWILSDNLASRGWEVLHLPAGKVHAVSGLVRREGDDLVYDQPAPRRKKEDMGSQGELF